VLRVLWSVPLSLLTQLYYTVMYRLDDGTTLYDYVDLSR